MKKKQTWGLQTNLSLHFFNIEKELFPLAAIKTLIILKIIAAQANVKLKRISPPVGKAIMAAGEELLADPNLPQHFPLKVFQTGSGTQTHMNVNEVLAYFASQKK